MNIKLARTSPANDFGFRISDFGLGSSRIRGPNLPSWRQPQSAIRNPQSAMRGAFTLVEVLVTLAFASILLPTVMQGISLCLSTAGLARQEAQAAALAHSKLSELLVTGDYQNGASSGDFGTDWSEYRWEAQLSNWDGVALEQLEVIVSWKHVQTDRSVSMTTLVYVPTGNGSAYLGTSSVLPGGLGQQVTGGTSP